MYSFEKLQNKIDTEINKKKRVNNNRTKSIIDMYSFEGTHNYNPDQKINK